MEQEWQMQNAYETGQGSCIILDQVCEVLVQILAPGALVFVMAVVMAPILLGRGVAVMNSRFSRAYCWGGRHLFEVFDLIERKLKGVIFRRTTFLILTFCSGLLSVHGATWYVDSTATGANNGTSWANAWTSFNQISKISPGDTVYISGGPSGSSRTYSVSSWQPAGGTASAPITYQIGQDSAHNGTAIFNGSGYWIHSYLANVVISGDAGDGQMHFSLADPANNNSYYSEAVDYPGGSLSSNARISYVNFGNIHTGMDIWPIGNNFEIDHTYAYIIGSSDHWGSFNTLQGSGWDQIRIHDNTIYLPHDSSSPAYGADGIQCSGTGLSLYNNAIIGYNSSTYVSGGGGQHQDGWQGLQVKQFKIYNNLVEQMGDFGLFGDIFVNSSDLWIYNNVVIGQGHVGAIAVGLDGGANSTVTLTGIIIANNTVDSDNQGISLNNVSTHTASFVNCLLANNILVNGVISTQNNPTTPKISNAFVTTAQAGTYFVNYAARSSNSDFHLLPAATTLIGQGTNLSSVFTTDKDGNARPASGAWDIGAYQYSSVPITNYTISASAGTGGSISPSGAVSVNSGNSQTFTITPSSGYQISSVTVDGTGVGTGGTYTFSNVTANHTISASFAATGVTPPSAPSNLSANPVSPSEIDLSWTVSTAGSNPIAGYHIYVNGSTTPAASVTTSSYQSTGLSANTAYSYAVTAYDSKGNESSQSTVSATTWPSFSTKFTLSQQVSIITGPANVRQQPTNELAGSVIGTQPSSAVATVVGGPIYAALNGVYYYWWNLSFSTAPSGWVAEDNLQAYSAPVNPAIQVTPGSIGFGAILSGATTSGSFAVKNIGGGTLSGTASVSAPFSIVSGANYSLTPNQSQTVTVSFHPTSAGNYSQNVTLTGGNGAGVGVSGSATNAPVQPAVSAISVDATDVDLNLSGLQIYSGTTLQLSATAANAQTWQWSYTVNGGSPVVYTNSASAITNISFYFDTNTVGNSYVWTLTVSNGLAWAQAQTNLTVEALPNSGQVITNLIPGPTVSATSGTLSGLLTSSTTINGVPTSYWYQPLFFIGSTTGGTATYNVTVTNAGDYEIEALVYAPNANADSFLVNIDGQPQSPSMLWDVTPYTSSGFEQRIVSWRGNGSAGNDQFTPKLFNLSAGQHQLIFVGSQPGTALASFSLVQVVTTVQPPPAPAAPTGLRIISSSF